MEVRSFSHLEPPLPNIIRPMNVAIVGAVVVMSSVSFDPVSGDSRVILGDAVLDYIHKTKPLTISSVPQRELENQGRVPEIFYQRFGRRTRLTSNRLEAVHVFPQIAVTLEDDLPWRMRGDTFTAPSLARNYFNFTLIAL